MSSRLKPYVSMSKAYAYDQGRYTYLQRYYVTFIWISTYWELSGQVYVLHIFLFTVHALKKGKTSADSAHVLKCGDAETPPIRAPISQM